MRALLIAAPLLAPALLAPLVLVVGACGYDPPAQTDRTTAVYAADLDTCRDTSTTDVQKQNVKTGLAWFASPVRRWWQIDDKVQACMAGKGYGRLRACTAEELRSGATAGNAVVTAAGVRCSEPPAPERRRAS